MVEVEQPPVPGAAATLYINAAQVPRVRSFPAAPADRTLPHGGASSSYSSISGDSIRGHHFVVVELHQHVVTAARDVWVGVQRPATMATDGGGGGAHCVLLHSQDLVRTAPSGDSSSGEYVCSIYRAFSDEWTPYVLPLPGGAAFLGASDERQAAGAQERPVT